MVDVRVIMAYCDICPCLSACHGSTQRLTASQTDVVDILYERLGVWCGSAYPTSEKTAGDWQGSNWSEEGQCVKWQRQTGLGQATLGEGDGKYFDLRKSPEGGLIPITIFMGILYSSGGRRCVVYHSLLVMLRLILLPKQGSG